MVNSGVGFGAHLTAWHGDNAQVDWFGIDARLLCSLDGMLRIVRECEGLIGPAHGLQIENVKTKEKRDLDIAGLFFAIGHEPATAFLQGQLQTDSDVCPSQL
jgi:hypothetical protein